MFNREGRSKESIKSWQILPGPGEKKRPRGRVALVALHFTHEVYAGAQEALRQHQGVVEKAGVSRILPDVHMSLASIPVCRRVGW